MTDPDSTSSPQPELPGTESPDSGPLPVDEAEEIDVNPARNAPPSPEDAEILRLKELLFAREIAILDRLQAFYNNPQITTRKVSDVLAEAIHLRSGKDRHLSMALEPLVDDIVKTSLNTRRNDFVSALSPLMGPTIRKSIAESFRSMMGSFGKSVELAFSWKGLRWRWEALRSGKSFGEVVLLHTLVYRVEQLFFIHNETGLVLSHVAGESVEAQDADMVSAMLTAVQDFVRDCFAGGKNEDLHSLQLGEFTVCIETGPRAYLACVIRGTPPPDIHERLRAALELMHVEYWDALGNFNGDAAPFAGTVGYLESCLSARYAEDNGKIPFIAKLIPALLLLAILAGLGYLHYANQRKAAEQARIAAEQAIIDAEQDAFRNFMHTALGYLRNEPGLLVLNVEEAPEAPWRVIMLKDVLGRSPDEVLLEHDVNPALFSTRITPFMSYDPSIVVRRVKKSIRPPETVSMVFDKNGTLTFTGTAPMSWIVATREDARAISGVEHVDVSGVRDPMMERISLMVAEVENTVIEFPLGKDSPVPADVPILKKVIDTLVELENITKQMGFSASLTIYGHADSVGDVKRNYEISQARARTVAGLLYAKGSSMPVAIYGMGAEHPRDGGQTATNREDQANRRIELRVHFSLSPSASSEMFRR